MVPGSVPTTPDVGGRADSSAAHAARDDGGGPVLSLDDHHRRVEARDLHCGVEHAIHELLEVDRASELAEDPVAAALLLGSLERFGQVSGELVHLAPHLVDRADELLILGSRGGLSAAHHDGNETGRGREGRGDDHDRYRHAVSQLIRTYLSLYSRNRGMQPRTRYPDRTVLSLSAQIGIRECGCRSRRIPEAVRFAAGWISAQIGSRVRMPIAQDP